jgi:hypothetical protein
VNKENKKEQTKNVAHKGKKINSHGVLVGKREVKHHLEELGVEGRITLNQIFKR